MLHPGKGEQAEHADDGGRGRRGRPAPARHLDEGVDHPRQTDGDRRGAGQVEPRPVVGLATLRHVPHRERDRDGGDRHVDEEHPPPRDGVDEPAAEERTDRRRDPRQARPGPHRPTPVLAPHDGVDERQAAGHQQRPTQTLDQPRRDQREPGRRQAAAEGRHGEQHEPGHEHPATPVPVTERATQQEQRGQREQVAVEHPLQRREAAPEVAADRRERHVHHGPVEERDPRAQGRGGDQPPSGRGGQRDAGRGRPMSVHDASATGWCAEASTRRARCRFGHVTAFSDGAGAPTSPGAGPGAVTRPKPAPCPIGWTGRRAGRPGTEEETWTPPTQARWRRHEWHGDPDARRGRPRDGSGPRDRRRAGAAGPGRRGPAPRRRGTTTARDVALRPVRPLPAARGDRPRPSTGRRRLRPRRGDRPRDRPPRRRPRRAGPPAHHGTGHHDIAEEG